MNREEFYQKIEEGIVTLNLEQTKKVIKNIIRKINPEDYQVVLDIIRDNCTKGLEENIKSNDKKLKETKLSTKDIELEIRKIKEKFALIDNFELYFYASNYEDEDDYNYWDSEYITEYTDESNIGLFLKEVYKYGIKLTHYKKYQEARCLFDLIISTNYQALDEEGGDTSELDIEDLYDNGLINFNLEELCLYTIYVTYQSSSNEKKCEEIYHYYKLTAFRNINVEDSFQLGIEIIKEEQLFWQNWINLLSNQKGATAYQLLKRALEVNHYNNYDRVSFNCINTHPNCFLDYLNYLNENNDYLNIIKQGNIALEKMNKEYIVRSKIAISIANAMLKLDSKSNINKYLYEAFVSDTSIANLLKILLNKDCFNEYHHKIVTIIHENDAKIKNKNSKEAYLNYSYDDTDEDDEFEDNEIVEESDAIERNSLSIREYRVLLLLLGDVDNTIGYLKGINNYLGWSYSDINQLIYLLLLLLYNGTKYTNVRIGMASNIVYKDDFIENRYLYNISNDNSRMMALDIMNSWKANYQLDEAKEQEILDLLAEKVRKRVAAILEGKYRQSYWKAAMVIVALGEVYESLNIMSKDDYAEEYHQKYRRFNAFRKELRESTYRYNW